MKLTDAKLRLMRTMRVEGLPKPSFQELALIFRIHPRSMRRLCMGTERPEAGGPFETSYNTDSRNVELTTPPFDNSRVIRCSECGLRTNPCSIDPKRCFRCCLVGHAFTRAAG